MEIFAIIFLAIFIVFILGSMITLFGILRTLITKKVSKFFGPVGMNILVFIMCCFCVWFCQKLTNVVPFKYNIEKVKTEYSFDNKSITIETITEPNVTRIYTQIEDLSNITDTTQFYYRHYYNIYGKYIESIIITKNELKKYENRK
jgi:hypothetical protein